MTMKNDGNPYAPYEPTAQVEVEEKPTTEVFPEDVTNIKDTLEWVGDNKDRARLVLESEESNDNPRKTLVKHLEEVING